jgi:hypothetical protein
VAGAEWSSKLGADLSWAGRGRPAPGFGALASVPDVDRRVVFVVASLRCPMLTGGDFGCAAWLGAVPDVDRRNLNDRGGL